MVDLITTARPGLSEIAAQNGFLIGCRLDDIKRHEEAGLKIDFIDIDFKKDQNEQSLLLEEKCMRHRPLYAVAGDYDGLNYDDINGIARRIRRYVGRVIIVPHESDEVKEIPPWAVVGYSIPTLYGGTDAPIWEYYNRDVHLLGGTPHEQIRIKKYLPNVVSIDGNSILKAATRFCKYWANTKPHWRELTLEIQDNKINEAFTRSVMNVSRMHKGGVNQ